MRINKKLHRSLTIAMRVSMLLYGAMLIMFGLFSGAAEGGWVANSPNALPGLALFIATLSGWVRPKLSATVILLWAILMGVFFSAWQNPIVFIFIVTLPLLNGVALFLLAMKKA